MLRLGLIPSVDPASMILDAQPFIQSLRSSLGIEAEAVVLPGYDAVGQGLLDGSIDIGFIGPAGYVVAKDRLKAPIVPIARGVLDVGGSSWGRAIIITRTDTGIETVSDLRGRSFTFSDLLSTSGYFFPYRVLAESGVNPEMDLRESRFSGSLGLSLQAGSRRGGGDAGNGNDRTDPSGSSGEGRSDQEDRPGFEGFEEHGVVDAAGIGDEILALAIKRGELQETDIRTIYESEPIPGSLFVICTLLEGDLLERVKRTILAMNNMPFCKIGLIRSMELASDEEYDIVRQALGEFERCYSTSCKANG